MRNCQPYLLDIHPDFDPTTAEDQGVFGLVKAIDCNPCETEESEIGLLLLLYTLLTSYGQQTAQAMELSKTFQESSALRSILSARR